MQYANGCQVGSKVAHKCSLTSTWLTACLAALALPASSDLCAWALSSVGAGLTGCVSMASTAVLLEALHPMC